MIRLALCMLVGLQASSYLRADDFAIDLNVKIAKDAKSADAKYPDAGKKPRAVLTASAKTALTVKWTARNIDKATVKDAVVHFFIVKLDKPDQQEVPKLTKNVVAESALTMDFKTQDKAEGEITIAIANPGVYLVRVEIKGTAAKSEPFAALDIIVR